MCIPLLERTTWQTDKSNTAIVQGALLRGLEDKAKDTGLPNWRLGARIANKHFGIECFEEFVEGKHDISRRYKSK